MTLHTGTTLGPYEITSPLGAGGMGEVYLARDTKLDRDVAIKVLPEMMTRDAERIARFEREAKLLASLNHPNVASVYGFDESNGARFLVLEYVDGETLGTYLKRSPLAVDDAIEITKQIAEALETAHAQGIIHRDLKPANVMVREDGTVKVLDFGLAKAMADEPSGSEIANSPTITANYTKPGVVLGTAAYMSPEQARGRAVDKRTDIWSFGIILFECLTGDRLFQGETANDSMGAIMHKEPDWSLLPAGTPPTVHLLIRRCLAKDRKQRLQDIGDARIELESALADPTSSMLNLASTALREPARRSGKRGALAFGFALGAIVAAAGTVGLIERFDAAEPPPVMRLSIPVDGANSGDFFTLSPDGTKVVFVAASPDNEEGQQVRQLWQRRLDAFEAVPLSGTQNASWPIFSPDSKRVAFIRDNDGGEHHADLEVAYLDGRPPVTLTNRAVDHNFPGWLSNDEIAFFDGSNSDEIMRISARGGEATRVAVLENSVGFDRFVPIANGTWLAVARMDHKEKRIDAINVETGAVQKFISDAAALRQPASDLLVFVRRNRLLATKFDVDGDGPRLVGDVIPIMPGVETKKSWQAHLFGFSKTGHFAYVPPGGENHSKFATVDMLGEIEPFSAEERPYTYVRGFSPDGSRLSFGMTGPESTPGTWIMELDTRAVRRMSEAERPAFGGRWLADGRFVFAGITDHGMDLLVTEMRRNAKPVALFPTGSGGDSVADVSYFDIIPNGSTVVLVGKAKGRDDTGIFHRDAVDQSEARPLVDSPASEQSPSISPDGRWLAFESDESGRREVYVIAVDLADVDAAANFHRVSNIGGREPFWSHDGAKLFFRDADRAALWAVDMEIADGAVQSGAPRKLFDLVGNGFNGRSVFLPMPDGERLLFVQEQAVEGQSGPSKRINIVLNWMRELEGLE